MFSFFRGSKPTTPPAAEQTEQPPPQAPEPTTSTAITTTSEPEFKLLNSKSKYKLFFGGVAFLTFSLWTTRRALNRRFKASIPPFYTSSVYHRPEVSGGAEAFEALNLATLNVLSFGMMGTGALLWAFDIDGIDDMRAYVRRGFESDGGDISGADVKLEEDIEKWVGSVLGKKFEDQLKREKDEAAAAAAAAGKS